MVVTMPNSLKLFHCMCSYALSSTAYVIDPRFMSQEFIP